MKQIPLTKGKFALVDDDDYEVLRQYNWCVQGEYAARWKSKKAGESGGALKFFMHRVICGVDDHSPDMEVDHINGNKLDNRKENLRICKHSENMKNQNSTNRFGYKGVVGFKNNKYQSMIWIDGKNLYLGMFSDLIDAARAYDDAAKKYFGNFARLNFPED